jgi:hypothetical protein
VKRYFAVLLLCVPVIAHANSAWPALYLIYGIYTWWVIAAGLAIEWLAIKWLFRLSNIRTTVVDIVANATSALCGLVLVPVSGLVYGIGRGILPTFLLAVLINLVVETAVMRFGFKLPVTRRATAVILAANVITVLLALIPMTQQLQRLP